MAGVTVGGMAPGASGNEPSGDAKGALDRLYHELRVVNESAAASSLKHSTKR